MDRKVYLTLTSKVVLRIPEGMEVTEAVSLLDLEAASEDIEVVDFNVENHEVTDSK